MPASQGVADDWADVTGGDFDDPANWLDGTVPLSTEDAVFNLGAGPYTVVLTQDQTQAGLAIQNDDVVFDLGGYKLQVNDFEGFSLAQASGGDVADVTMFNGELQTVSKSSFGMTGSVANLTLTGPDMYWAMEELDLGAYGQATLEVLSGARVVAGSMAMSRLATTAEGYLRISGAGSGVQVNYLGVGSDGLGEIVVEDGGTLALANTFHLGLSSASSQVLVTGEGSTLKAIGSGNQTLNIGYGSGASRGSLFVEDGGLVQYDELSVGASSSDIGLLRVGQAGDALVSRVELSQSLWIGEGSSSFGTVEINRNGELQVTNTVEVGGSGQYTDVLKVDGGLLESGRLHVAATGRLDLRDGVVTTKELNVDGALAVGGFGVGDRSVLNVGISGGTIQGDVYVGGDALGARYEGELNIAAFSEQFDFEVQGDVQVYSPGVLNINGMLFADSLSGEGLIRLDTGSADVGVAAVSYDIDGSFEWVSGLLRARTGVFSTDDLPLDVVTVGADSRLEVGSQLSIEAGDTVVVDGGEVRFGTLAGGGSLQLLSGTATATGGPVVLGTGGLLGDDLVVGDDVLLQTLYGRDMVIGAASAASLTIQGSGRVSTDEMTVASNGSVQLNGGRLSANVIDTSAGGGFSFVGGVLSVNTYRDDLTQQGGTLDVGGTAGITVVEGGYNLEAGTLDFKIAGASAASGFDELQVSGAVTLLGGTLSLSLQNDYVPAAGQAFDILDFASLTGTFAGVDYSRSAGIAWDLSDLYTIGTIRAELLGDLDDDKALDFNDVLALVMALVDPVSYGAIYGVDADVRGDFTGDGVLNFDDISPFANALNLDASQRAALLAAVPEPATGVWLSVTLLAAGRGGRRGWRRG